MAMIIITSDTHVGVDDKLLARFCNQMQVEYGTTKDGIFERELAKLIERGVHKELEIADNNQKIKDK